MMENSAFYLSLTAYHNAFMEGGGGGGVKDMKRYFKEQINKRFHNSLQSDQLSYNCKDSRSSYRVSCCTTCSQKCLLHLSISVKLPGLNAL